MFLTTIHSACGKTRSLIEMLSLQWGYYFSAAKSDFGSDDLCRLADIIDNKTLGDVANTDTVFAKNMILLLFLSRLMVLDYCLRVSGCRQIFSSARWTSLASSLPQHVERMSCAYILV